MTDNTVYIVAAKRSPIGRFQGSLSRISPQEIGTQIIQDLAKTAPELIKQIDQIYCGQVLQAGHGQNIARQIALQVGAHQATGTTLNMVCGSGMKSVINGIQAIQTGQSSCIIAGGIENMSQAPHLLRSSRTGKKLGDQTLIDSMIHDGLWDHQINIHMGKTAENIQKKYSISRKRQDQYAQESHHRALKEPTQFQTEITPIKSKNTIKTDECPRNDTTSEKLETLSPVFDPKGTITAGNASGLADGGCLLILANQKTVQKMGWTPMAKVEAYHEAAVAPELMGMGPVPAIAGLLQKANTTLSDYPAIEINEAFAAQVCAIQDTLSISSTPLNRKGGAIALGHPIGASGARIICTLLHILHENQFEKGLASTCIGGGMGTALSLSLNTP